jgi:hypothetical protein
MGHAHFSGLEQSCQGATHYRQSILVREKKQHLSPAAIWNLKTQAPYLFLNYQLKAYCQEWKNM